MSADEKIHSGNREWVLYLPRAAPGGGLGNVMRCLSVSSYIGVKTRSCFCLPAFFPDLERFWHEDVKRVDENRLNEILPRCTAVVVDNQYPAEVSAIGERIREINRDVPIIALDHTGSVLKSIDVYINLRNYGETVYDLESRTKYYESLDYAIIRRNFFPYRPQKPTVRETVCNILISFGGEDIAGWTLPAILWIEKHVLVKLNVMVVLAGLKRNKEEIYSFLKAGVRHRYNVSNHIVDIEKYMSECDVAFCSAGTTLMEFAYLGKPVISLPQNDMERSFLRIFQQCGYLPWKFEESFTSIRMGPAIRLFRDRELRIRIAKNGMNTIDGKGCSRVANIVMSIIRPGY